MSEWSEDKCLLLIDAYRKHSMLWNPKDHNYYKKHSKEDAWAIIGGTLNENGQACKQKMVNILASYRRENMKIKKSARTGKGKEEIYESKWYAFKVLGFLNDRFTPRRGLKAGDVNKEVKKLGNMKEIITNTPTPSLEPPNKKLRPDPRLQMLKETGGEPQQDMELKLFFDFIQEKMKHYSRDTKIAIQHEIFQIVMRADLGNCMKSHGNTTQK